MFITTEKATIEYASRAGQAVLQYREYKAAQSDAVQERARNEVNQMFADQGRVLWNSAVNIAEGTINGAVDIALSNNGQIPAQVYNDLPEQVKPHVDFSPVKSDYRSEMMRRDLNGKVDGDGIKMGQAVETGVTIGAPFVIGAATAPKAAPQSLKTLGGIPEEINLTTQTSKVVQTADVQSVKSVSKISKSTYREVEIIDKSGNPIGEFDKIEKGLFVEDKSAKGLSVLHPKTGKLLQTTEQWARKQIFEKSVTRIENLLNKAVSTRTTKNGSPVVPSLDEIKTIRKLQFRIEGDSIELRKAVGEEIKNLSKKYPDWEFSAEFGK